MPQGSNVREIILLIRRVPFSCTTPHKLPVFLQAQAYTRRVIGAHTDYDLIAITSSQYRLLPPICDHPDHPPP